MEQLTSRTSDKVKALIKLREQSKIRLQNGVFFAEGLRLCNDFVQTCTLHELYLTKKAFESAQLLENAAKEVYEISDSVAEKLSDTKTTQGVFAVFAFPEYDCALHEKGRYLLLEHIQNPANIGALMRSAAAFGYDGVLLCSECADPFSGKALRASMGSVAKINVMYYSDIMQAKEALQKKNIALIAACLQNSKPLQEVKKIDTGIAICIGNEGNGLTESALECADIRVHIPMEQGVESLNAAVAGGVLLWHFSKQGAD